MKTRQGFVSNSSSSSFVVIVKKKTLEAAKATCTEEERLAVSACEQEFTFCGEKLVLMMITTGDSYKNSFHTVAWKYNEKQPKVRGCDHKLPEGDIKYCPECGCRAWRDAEVISKFSLECAFKNFVESLKEIGGDSVYVDSTYT